MSPYRIPACAGKPYRPSNGSEGSVFQATFCNRCVYDAFDDYDGSPCPILNLALSRNIDDPLYPSQYWTHTEEGEPTCTAFRPKNKNPEPAP